MLLAKFMTRLLKIHGYSDVVIAFSGVLSRESRCCSPPSPPQIQNAACRHDHRRAKSDGGTSRILTSAGAITIAVQAASPKRVVVLHLRHRHRHRHRHRKSGKPRVVTITDEPSLFAVTSRIHTSAGAATIAVRLASKRDIAKAIQS